jgi:dTDP-4-dehydrorhamnose reductase
MKIVVIGANGQLGTDLMKAFQRDHEVMGLTHKEVEVTDPNSFAILRDQHPDVIINTAAFHKVDQCEDEPLKAFSVNALGARNIAVLSKEMEAITVYISTDYVFDGAKTEPYTEDDFPVPVNTYGISKLAGELYTMQNPKHYIFRVASLFGVAGASGKGGNFVETIIGKAQKKEPISVVDDMWMSPTYTLDAAKIIKAVLESKMPFGAYHATNAGYCTWFQFSQEIFKVLGLKPALTSIKTEQLQMKAKRPKFSALKSVKLPEYGVHPRNWRQALRDYLTAKGHLSQANATF